MEDLLIVLVYFGGIIVFPILIIGILFLIFLVIQFISYRIFHFNLYQYCSKSVKLQGWSNIASDLYQKAFIIVNSINN